MLILKSPIVYRGCRSLLTILSAYIIAGTTACKSWGKFWEIEEPDICQRNLAYSQVSEAQYSDLFLKYLRAQRDRGSSGSATTQYTMTGLTTTAYKWLGGVLAPNGQIYAMPFAGNLSALIINPLTGTTSFSAATSGTGERAAGGVLASNGKIYAIPYAVGSTIVMDPTNNATSLVAAGTTSPRWAGAVLAPNGKIYGIPADETSVLIVDPQTNTVDTTSMPVAAGTSKWTGGVLAPNGKIYGIPSTANTVLVIDPLTNTADTTSITVPAGAGKWAGGALAPNGKIYGIPAGSDGVLVIDTKSNGSFCSAVLQSAYLNKF